MGALQPEGKIDKCTPHTPQQKLKHVCEAPPSRREMEQD